MNIIYQTALFFALILKITYNQTTNGPKTASFAFPIPPFPVSSNSNQNVFSYNFGGDDWPNLNNSCSFSSQSPINLDRANPSIAPNGYNLELLLLNNFTTSEFNIDQTLNAVGNFTKLTANDTNGVGLIYNGVGFQVHAPAEHFYNSRLYDIELQLIHQLDPSCQNLTNNYYAIVSIFYTAIDGESSRFFSSFNLTNPSKTTKFNMFEAFQPDFALQSSYFQYSGSMTKPTCDEKVNWFVLSKPVPMSLQQLGQIDLNFKINKNFANGRGNNRFWQDLNQRTVLFNNFVNNMAVDLSMSPFFGPVLSGFATQI